MKKILMIMALLSCSLQASQNLIPTTASAVIQPMQNSSPEQILQSKSEIYNFNFNSQSGIADFCPFLSNFQTIPQAPATSSIPTDNLTDLQNWVTNTYTPAAMAFQTFGINFSNAVLAFQNNTNNINASSNFNNLVSAANTNYTNFTNAMNAHSTCVSNAKTSCNNELINLLNATNALYDAYAAVLNLLAKYKLAPSWANPVVRVQIPATVTNSQGNTFAFTCVHSNDPDSSECNGQIIQINTIQNFDAASFQNQIGICQKYLMQDCLSAITQVNNSLTTVQNNFQTVGNTVQSIAATLPVPATQPSLTQNIQTDVMSGVNIVMTTRSFDAESLSEIDLEMPAFIAYGVLINSLGSLVGAQNDPLDQAMSQVGAQMDQDMIDSWAAIAHAGSAGQALTDIGFGLSNTLGVFVVGLSSLLITTLDTVTNILTGQTSGGGGSISDPYDIATSF